MRTVMPARPRPIELVIVAIAVATAACTVPEAHAGSWLFVSLKDEQKIAVYDRDTKSGAIQRSSYVDCPGEPGPLSVSRDGRVLFASIRSTGQLASYRIDPASGELTELSVIEAGEDPAFHTTDPGGRFLLTAYYRAAKVTVHRVQSDGKLLPTAVQSVPTAPKAHGFAFDGSGRFGFVPHTGSDAIYQFRFDPDRTNPGPLLANDPPILKTPAGDAPRHIVVHPRRPFAWTDNEAGDSVTAFRIVGKKGTLSPLQTVSTLPRDFETPEQNACAALQMTPDGRFLYAANRGHDSVACFAIDQETGWVTSLGQESTGRTPRSISVAPGGQFLYAAGQNDNSLWVYRIQGDGRLKHLSTQQTGVRPWWILAVQRDDERL